MDALIGRDDGWDRESGAPELAVPASAGRAVARELCAHPVVERHGVAAFVVDRDAPALEGGAREVDVDEFDMTRPVVDPQDPAGAMPQPVDERGAAARPLPDLDVVDHACGLQLGDGVDDRGIDVGPGSGPFRELSLHAVDCGFKAEMSTANWRSPSCPMVNSRRVSLMLWGDHPVGFDLERAVVPSLSGRDR